MNFKYIYVYTFHDNAKTHRNTKTRISFKKRQLKIMFLIVFQKKKQKKVTPVVSKQPISDVRQRCKVVFMFNLGLL